jgi:hypothetical protein
VDIILYLLEKRERKERNMQKEDGKDRQNRNIYYYGVSLVGKHL